jgi:hypothetical protein
MVNYWLREQGKAAPQKKEVNAVLKMQKCREYLRQAVWSPLNIYKGGIKNNF